MAEQAGIKVKNLKQVTQALKAIGVPNDAVKAAGKTSAQAVVNEAQRLVPVRSGKLRDSIRISATARSKITIQAGNNRTSKSGIPYANPIHWGWFKRNIKPQPFFVKALGLTRAEVFNNYFRQMENLLEEESRKAKAKS
jgi:HK97 gp10 family phage protein